MDRQAKKAEIKYLSGYKWASPNRFNGSDAILAYISAIACLFLMELLAAPLIQLMKNLGVGLGALMCVTAIMSQGTILLVALVFCKIKGIRLFGGGIRFSFDFASCLPAIVLTIGTFLAFMPVHMYFVENMGEVQKIFFGLSSLDNMNIPFAPEDMIYMMFYMLILVPCLPAICEEALFRGVVMNGLREFGSVCAIFLSGLLFALMHGSYMQLLLQFVIGCEIAFVVITTGNYFAGCVMHFTNNLFSTIYSVMIGTTTMISPAMGIMLDCFLIIVGIALCCTAIVYYVKLDRFKHARKFDDYGRPINRKFLFYKEKKEDGWCRLAYKGNDQGYSFNAELNYVIGQDNSNMLYFYDGKFRKFTIRSSKSLFVILTICAIVLAVALIVLSFIS